jgi:hypothetical protein
LSGLIIIEGLMSGSGSVPATESEKGIKRKNKLKKIRNR